MPTGRGQFFLSLKQALEWTQRPGRHGGNGKKNPARACRRRSRRSGENASPTPPSSQVERCPTRYWSLSSSSCGINYFNNLPSEIILKIFSYLDVEALFCVGFVSRQFHELANDSVVWYELYSRKLGRRSWRPRLQETMASEREDVHDVPAAVWQRLLFSEMGCHKDAVWKKDLRHVNLSTGMPEQTTEVLSTGVASFTMIQAAFMDGTTFSSLTADDVDCCRDHLALASFRLSMDD